MDSRANTWLLWSFAIYFSYQFYSSPSWVIIMLRLIYQHWWKCLKIVGSIKLVLNFLMKLVFNFIFCFCGEWYRIMTQFGLVSIIFYARKKFTKRFPKLHLILPSSEWVLSALYCEVMNGIKTLCFLKFSLFLKLLSVPWIKSIHPNIP